MGHRLTVSVGALQEPFDRLALAAAQRELFECEVATFLDLKPYAVVREKDRQSREWVWRVWVNCRPPLELRVRAGDCIHNMRACLDNAIWALAKTVADDPPKNTAFVIGKDESAFNGGKWKLKVLPQDVQDMIESLQPHSIGVAPEEHEIWVLDRLWNDDKHRAPSLMQFVMQGMTLPGIYPPGLQGYHGAIDEGAVIVRSPIEGTRPAEGTNSFDPEVAFDVAFRDHARAITAAQALLRMHNAVLEVLQNLARIQPLNPRRRR